MMEVVPLALDLQVPLGTLVHGFPPALTALLAARDAALRLLEPLLGFPVVAGILHRLPLCSHQEDLQPDVDAGLLSSERQRFYWYLRTGDGDIPAVRFPADRDGLGRTLKRAVNAHGDPANFGEAEHPAIQY